MLVKRGFVVPPTNPSLSSKQSPWLTNPSMKVFVADSDVQGLRALGRKLNTDSHNQSVYTTEVDVAEWDSIERAFRYAVGAFGRVDYVFPIAGTSSRPHN